MDIAWLVFRRLENGRFLLSLGGVRDRTIYNLVIPPYDVFWPRADSWALGLALVGSQRIPDGLALEHDLILGHLVNLVLLILAYVNLLYSICQLDCLAVPTLAFGCSMQLVVVREDAVTLIYYFVWLQLLLDG